MTTHTFHMHLTHCLPNGAQILRRAALPAGQWLVFAVWQKSDKARREYVTWFCEPNGNAYWGHYFQGYEMAEQDYLERLAAHDYHALISGKHPILG